MIIGNNKDLIYSNFIQPQFVGNKLIRCLRTFISPSVYCQHNFENIYYIPVQKRHIQHIRIEVKNLKDQPITLKDVTVPTKFYFIFGVFQHGKTYKNTSSPHFSIL